MKYRLLLVLSLFLLQGCEAPRLNPFSVNTYQEERPISLSVNAVKIESDVKKFDRLPHLEDKMPIPPEEALRRWGQNRFSAVGYSSPIEAVVTIQKAYMTQTEENSDNWFVYNNVNYKLTYALILQFKQDDKILYTQDVDGWESSSLPWRSSLAEKEEAWQKMMNAMIEKVNNKIVKGIPSRFLADSYR